MPDPITLSAFRNAVRARSIATSNLNNLARTIFKPETTIKYNVSNNELITPEIGKVVEVKREGAEVYLMVIPIKGKKPKRIKAEHVLDFMQGG